MTLRCLLIFVAGVLLLPSLVSCRKKEKVVVEKQRTLTMHDQENDRLVAVMPPEWRQLPGTQFRLLNYRFGEDGEVYVSTARGSVLANLNRWLQQFGQPPVTDTDAYPKITVLGSEGIIVNATGKFGGGMGKPARENAALMGVIVALGDELLTVKMIGDKQAVLAEKERMEQFCKKLRIREVSSDQANN